MAESFKVEEGNIHIKFIWLFAIITIFSQIALFLKDIVIAQVFGMSLISDAYFYACQIPFVFLIILGGIGGPFHKATITVFSNITKLPKKQIRSFLNSFITLTGFYFLVLSILTFIFSSRIIGFIIPKASEALQNLAATQLEIMSPIIFIGGIIGILYGISNVYNDFFSTSLSIGIASSIFIATVLMFGEYDSGRILALAALFGAVGQFLFQSLAFFISGFIYKPEFNFSDEKMDRIKKILIPTVITVAVAQIYVFIDMFFVSGFVSGSWSAICYANRIFLAVAGIIIISVVLPLVPAFSTNDKQDYLAEFRIYFYKSLNFVWFTAFPVMVFMMFFAQDIAKIVFERGKFNPNDASVVSTALIFLSLAIIPYLMKDIIIRIYYVIDDLKVPFFITILSLLIKVGMNYLLVNIAHLGIKGIVISTAVVTLIDVILLAKFLKNKISIDYGGFIYPIMQIIQVTILMSVFVYGTKFYLGSILPYINEYPVIKLVISAIIAIAVYIIFSFVLKLNIARDFVKYTGDILVKNSDSGLLNSINQEIESVKSIINSPKIDFEHLYKELKQEKNKSDTLLDNVLPDEVAKELKEKGKVEPVHYNNASVMFTDFESYTKISKILSADELVHELDSCFNSFDKICGKFKLEKIKTIGDSYMCVGGIPLKNKTHAIDCVLAAFSFLQYINTEKNIKETEDLPFFNIRIGINTGELVAGVIGTKKSAYDVWGDTVNLASRMESCGEVGKINISESTYNLIKYFFECSYRGEIEVKNIGKVKMYFVEAIKPEFSVPNNNWLPNKKFYDCYKKMELG